MLKVSYPVTKWLTLVPINTQCFFQKVFRQSFLTAIPSTFCQCLSMFSQDNWCWFLPVLELNLSFGLLVWYSFSSMALQAWINAKIPFAPITLRVLCFISPQPITHVLLSEASVVKRQSWSREYSLTSDDLCGRKSEIN